MSEKDLIIKYVPSYASEVNPSSWSNVSEFDVYEILHNPGDVYGLTHEPRLEVSKLITNMLKIADASQSNIKITPGLTIHMLYEQIRSAVATQDKLENK